jgi:hypothetical protein
MSSSAEGDIKYASSLTQFSKDHHLTFTSSWKMIRPKKTQTPAETRQACGIRFLSRKENIVALPQDF